MRLMAIISALLALTANLAAQHRMEGFNNMDNIFQVNNLEDWFKLNEYVVETGGIKQDHVCVGWNICNRSLKTVKPKVDVKNKSGKEAKKEAMIISKVKERPLKTVKLKKEVKSNAKEAKIISKVKNMLRVQGRLLPGIRITHMWKPDLCNSKYTFNLSKNSSIKL